MKIFVAGATGSIGLHGVNSAIKMDHQPVALIRNKSKVKSPPRGVTELRRPRQLEDENQRLKKRVADLSLDKEMLQAVLK